MKSLGLLGVVAAVVGATAVVSPCIAWGVAAVVGRPFTFARVFDRVFEVLLVVGILAAWRRLDLGTAREIGFRREESARDLWTGLWCGVVGLTVGLTLAALLGGLDVGLRYPVPKTIRKALLGAAAAIVIGVGEEAIFRGVLFRRLRRDVGTAAGVAVTTAVYAAVHAIRSRHGVDGSEWWAGFAQTASILTPLARAAALPQLLGLLLLGGLLAALRLRTGTLWMPIGVHAAFVAAFRIGRLFFDVRAGPGWLVGTGWPPLIGGLAGWTAVACTAALSMRKRAAVRRT